MSYRKVPYENLKKFCTDVFKGYGYSQEESEDIVDVLLQADLFGIESHGVQRLIRYHRSLMQGKIHPDARASVISETPVSAVLDAHGGAGQLTAIFAMRKAIEKAKNTGIGFVIMKNTNHYGIAAYYSLMAAKEDLIGLSFTNTEAMMPPTFGRQAMLGSNPIAVAMPADPYPFSYDGSTTVVPRGKLEVYNKKEEPLPNGWGVDEKGMDCNDAAVILDNIINCKGGGILPVGGSSPLSGSHKGYGYGMMCELFTSILTGGPTSNHWRRGETSQSFIAIDYGMFGDKKEIRQHMSTFMQELRDSNKAEGQDRIYTHGEKEFENEKVRKTEGIPVNEKTEAEMREIAEYLHLDYEAYLG